MSTRNVIVTTGVDGEPVLVLGKPPFAGHTVVLRAALAVTIDPAAGARLQSIGVLDRAVARPVLTALLGADAMARLDDWNLDLVLDAHAFGTRELTVEWDDRLGAILARMAEIDWLERLSPADLPRAALQLERGLLAVESGLEQLEELAPLDLVMGSAVLPQLRELLEQGARGSVPLIGRLIGIAEVQPDLVGPPDLVLAVRRAWDAGARAAAEAAEVDWGAVLGDVTRTGPDLARLHELATQRGTAREPVDYRVPIDRLHVERGVLEHAGAYADVFAAQWEDRGGGRFTVAVRVASELGHGALRVRLVDADGAVGYDGPLAPTRPAIVEARFSWPQPLRPGEFLDVYSPDIDLGADDAEERAEHLLAMRVAAALQAERFAARGAAAGGARYASAAWDAAIATAEQIGRDTEFIAGLDARRNAPVPVELTLAEELLIG